MGLFNFFKKKQVPTEVTSFEVGYVLNLRDSFPEHEKEEAFKRCSQKKWMDGKYGIECSFCKHLFEAKKIWTRVAIEQLTLQLGYSVYDNVGHGYDKGGNSVCVCEWKSEVVVKRQNK